MIWVLVMLILVFLALVAARISLPGIMLFKIVHVSINFDA